jgi:4-amino-4-deoxy-L-arabinose transferase-like glycosyltransferase
MISAKGFYAVLILSFITYILGIFCVPLMDVDAAQYASISREMLANKSFLQVYDLGTDYLDKPPMLFWLSAASMYIFGIADWAYRLPSFLFAVLAILSTYKLALLFYKKEIAQLSALALATCQAMFLITHDVRTDTMLMGWVITAVWQLAVWFNTQQWKNFIIAFVCIAGGMLTKGPIALVVPVGAFAIHFILQRNWQVFFKWHYLVGIVLIAICLLPMSIGLYQQYDLQPGKLINGHPIKSGLEFYYWTQSFGRYTGENHFKEMSYFGFLFENMLWSFMPWIVFFVMGLISEIIQLVKTTFKLQATQEFIAAGGFIVTYLILSRSQAQLPHYIFVVFPFVAIVTGKQLYSFFYENNFPKLKYFINGFHLFVFTVLWLAVMVLLFFSFTNIPKYVACIAGICLLAMYYLLSAKKLSFHKYLEIAFFSIIGINIFLNTAIYPSIIQYQIGSTAAAIVEEKKIPKNKLQVLAFYPGHSFHFYSNYTYSHVIAIDSLQPNAYALCISDSVLAIQKKFPKSTIVYEGESYGVTQLSLPFLNPATRSKEVGHYSIVKVEKR